MQADDELLGAGDELEAAPDGNRLEPLGGSYSEGLQKLIGFADGPEEWRETETLYWVAFDVAAIGLTGPKLLAIHEKVHSLERFWHTDGAILLELGRREELGLQFLNQELVNRILSAKRHLVDTSEITQRTFADMFATCQRVGDVFGWNRLVVDLTPEDFDGLRRRIAKQCG